MKINYNRFISNISNNPSHYGKFFMHYRDMWADNEEHEQFLLFRFGDFIDRVRRDMAKYEHYQLKDNVRYKFQLYIHSPDHEKSAGKVRQHSTTMTVMYRVRGMEVDLQHGDNVHIIIHDHDTTREYDMTVDDPDTFMTLQDNEIIKVLELDGDKKVLKVIKSNHTPYFNFSTNPIIATDRWALNVKSNLHHSIAYIVGSGIFYKFPDERSNQTIDFNVYVSNNVVYHRCTLSPEMSIYIEHYEGKCCFNHPSTMRDTETKSIVEDVSQEIQTISHTSFIESSNNPKQTVIVRLNQIHKTRRLGFMNLPRNVYLVKYVESLKWRF